MKRYLNIAYHLLFWIGVCWFFIFFSYIRPSPIGAMYKEPLSVLFIAIMIYANYLLFIPFVFQKGEIKQYWYFAISSVIIAGLSEFLLVFPNIYRCFMNSVSPENLMRAFVSMLLLIIVRDFCFFLVFFLLKLYNDLSAKYIRDTQFISEETNSLFIVKSNGKIKCMVEISDIVYISKSGNYTCVHLFGGNVEDFEKHYITLEKTEQMLPKNCYFRISRSHLIIRSQILESNNNFVTMNLKKEGKYLNLPITGRYNTELLKKEIKETIKRNQEVKGIEENNRELNLKVEGIEQKIDEIESKVEGIEAEKIPENVALPTKKAKKRKRYKLSPSAQRALSIIKENPGCRTPLIASTMGLAEKTIEMHIKNLVDRQLIEFRGVTRYGGYHAIEEKESTNTIV